MMAIRVCVAGATGWTGRAVTGAILASSDLQLVGAIARRQVGVDIGEALGHGRADVTIVASLEEALAVPTDVLIDYTTPDVVKDHILAALDKGVRVVVGTSRLTASDYIDIEQRAGRTQSARGEWIGARIRSTPVSVITRGANHQAAQSRRRRKGVCCCNAQL